MQKSDRGSNDSRGHGAGNGEQPPTPPPADTKGADEQANDDVRTKKQQYEAAKRNAQENLGTTFADWDAMELLPENFVGHSAPAVQKAAKARLQLNAAMTVFADAQPVTLGAFKQLLEGLMENVATLHVTPPAPRWTLAYEHDAEGKCIAGSLQDLQAAANGGADIKVLFISSYNVAKVASCVWVHADKVVADFHQQFSCTNTGYFQDNAYWFASIAQTNGVYDNARYNVSGGQDRGHSNGKSAMKWLVRA
jgi:hypothetical protein